MPESTPGWQARAAADRCPGVQVQELLNMRIYVDTDDDVRLARR